MVEKNKPIRKFRSGQIVADVWKNTKEVKTDNGAIEQEYFSVSISKNYKDGDEWKTTNNYFLNDLQKLLVLVTKVCEELGVTEVDLKE